MFPKQSLTNGFNLKNELSLTFYDLFSQIRVSPVISSDVFLCWTHPVEKTRWVEHEFRVFDIRAAAFSYFKLLLRAAGCKRMVES